MAPVDYVPYNPRQILGRGSFGEVEKLKNRSDDRKVVACKTIRYFDAPNSQGLHQITREAVDREYEILSSLKHPNIVQHIDFQSNEAELEAKLYMEFCAGGSLQDYIKALSSEQTAPEIFVWKILAQLASALAYCHEGVSKIDKNPERKLQPSTRRILHRDIKPGNVFFAEKVEELRGEPIVKLGDFGLGVILEGGQAHDTYVGTKLYKAPEINYSESSIKWTVFCDIFSLGCTMYHLCNLKPPFPDHVEAEDAMDEAMTTLEDTDYSTDLKHLIMDCMAYNPASRPDSITIQQQGEEYLRTLDPTRPENILRGQKKGSILPKTPIAATCWPQWQYRIYFQDASGGIRESRHDAGRWTGGDINSVICTAKLRTPLAVTSSGEGKEIHVFYLTEKNILQEHWYTRESGWRPGRLNKLRVQASPYSRVAAVQLSDSIRVYYQEPTSNAIQEYCYAEIPAPRPKGCISVRRVFKRSGPTTISKWIEGAKIQADALQGTSLAAATWGDGSIRLYYQDSGRELREHCSDNAGQGWYVGHMAAGTLPKQAPISAFAWSSPHMGIQIRIYWLDKEKHLAEVAWSGGWHKAKQVVYMGNSQFSAVQWKDGTNVRVYYQGSDRRVLEKCYSNSGDWYNGSQVGASEDDETAAANQSG